MGKKSGRPDPIRAAEWVSRRAGVQSGTQCSFAGDWAVRTVTLRTPIPELLVARYLGAHTVANGGIGMAALRAGNAGMKALQIFTAPPQYYGDKATIRPDRVQRFRSALEQAGIAPERVVVHAAYVLNTATEDETKSARARAGLAKELERSSALGVGGICFHPGATTGGDRYAAA